ncbi:MAG: PadR family transcriptional regulator [Pseudomonadota bacterium]
MFPSLSQKEYVIMDLMRVGREVYGLELVNDGKGKLKRGTIYVTLNRMIEKGLISSRRTIPKDELEAPRRLYKITGHGQRVLEATERAMASIYSEAKGV